jgi:co-chaperonin GroES (HSP10)
MATIKGNIKPISDKILITDMNFGMEQTKSGIVITSDNGKAHGVKPRWGKVWAVGPEQKEIKVNDWIMMEHGRWTRTWNIEQDDGSILEVRGVDNKAIILVSDEKPDDIELRA